MRFGEELKGSVTGRSMALNIGSYQEGHALGLLESKLPLIYVKVSPSVD